MADNSTKKKKRQRTSKSERIGNLVFSINTNGVAVSLAAGDGTTTKTTTKTTTTTKTKMDSRGWDKDDAKKERKEIAECVGNPVDANELKERLASYNDKKVQRVKRASHASLFTEAAVLKPPGFGEEELERWRGGFLHCSGLVEPAVVEVLKELHETVLPTGISGCAIHGGQRARVCLDFTDLGCVHREDVPEGMFAIQAPAAAAYKGLKKGMRGKIGVIRGGADEKAKYERAIGSLRRAIAMKAGRNPDEIAILDFMTSPPRASAQSWHQDGYSAVLGGIVYLTPARATLYANYKDVPFLTKPKDFIVNHMSECWKLALREDHEPNSAGEVKAGDVLFSNTVHIHKSPQPNSSQTHTFKDHPRRTMFFAFESPKTACENVTIFSPAAWAGRSGTEVPEVA